MNIIFLSFSNRCYEVIVVKLEKGQEFPSGPGQYPPGEDKTYEDCKKEARCFYKAVVINE